MKKKICWLLIVILAVFCVPTFAEDGQLIATNENLDSELIAEKEEKVDNGFIADEDVTLTNPFNTTTFVAGNNVEMNSEVDGANFVAGNNVKVSSVQDYLFTAGNNVVVDGVSSKDAFIVGNKVEIKSSMTRDLYVAGTDIVINSTMTRNIYAGGDRIVINAYIDGDLKVASENITVGEETVITGKLLYPKTAKITIDKAAQVNMTETYEGDYEEVEVTPTDIVSGFIISYVGLLIVAFILLAINKKFFKAIEKTERNAASVVKTMAIGFGTLILVPIAAIFALVTVVGIPLTIIALLLYGICIYLSAIPTAYFVGGWIMKDNKPNEYLLLALSLLALSILKVIPGIGGLIGFASLIFGLGFFATHIICIEKEKGKEKEKTTKK